VEIHNLKIRKEEVAVRVKEKGIGVEEKFHRNIFEGSYRINVECEDT